MCKDLRQKILDVETQLALISDIHDYINKKDNLNQMLPASTGLKSDGINDLINNYNKLLLDRNRLSRIASNSNTAMLSLNSQIESLFNHVKKIYTRNQMNWICVLNYFLLCLISKITCRNKYPKLLSA